MLAKSIGPTDQRAEVFRLQPRTRGPIGLAGCVCLRRVGSSAVLSAKRSHFLPSLPVFSWRLWVLSPCRLQFLSDAVTCRALPHATPGNKLCRRAERWPVSSLSCTNCPMWLLLVLRGKTFLNPVVFGVRNLQIKLTKKTD